MRIWNRVGETIDSINAVMGRIGWFLILFMMSFGFYDVVMRYLFDMPSQWIYIALKMAMVVLTAIAVGHALQNDTFVRVDVIYERFSRRGKAIADVITFLLFVLPLSVILIWKGTELFQVSLAMRQTTPSAVRIPLYHIKALIPLAGFFILLVAGKSFCLDIKTLFYKKSDS